MHIPRQHFAACRTVQAWLLGVLQSTLPKAGYMLSVWLVSNMQHAKSRSLGHEPPHPAQKLVLFNLCADETLNTEQR